MIHLQEDVTRGRIRGCLLKLDESSTLPGFFTLSNPQLGAHSTAGGQPVRREPETRKEVLRSPEKKTLLGEAEAALEDGRDQVKDAQALR